MWRLDCIFFLIYREIFCFDVAKYLLNIHLSNLKRGTGPITKKTNGSIYYHGLYNPLIWFRPLRLFVCLFVSINNLLQSAKSIGLG